MVQSSAMVGMARRSKGLYAVAEAYLSIITYDGVLHRNHRLWVAQTLIMAVNGLQYDDKNFVLRRTAERGHPRSKMALPAFDKAMHDRQMAHAV